MSFRSVALLTLAARPAARRSGGSAGGLRGAGLWVVSALASVLIGCSSGGALPEPTPVPCSATRPCPSGFVCVLERKLCALAPSGDLAGPPGDLSMGPADMTMEPGDMTMMPADMTMMPADLAMMPVDMAMPMDLAMPPVDLAMTPVDMAMMPLDMAMMPADLAMMPADMRVPPDLAVPLDLAVPADMRLPPDLYTPPVDMRVTPDMATPPPPSEACSGNWCWENPLPQPYDLLGVWGMSATNVWAVGVRGVVLRFNGLSWVQAASGTTQRLRGIWGRSGSQVWMVGDNGTILYWDGFGFTAQASGTTESLTAIWGDSMTVWAVGEKGTLLKRSGTTWTKVAIGTTNSLYSIWGSASNDIWAVGEGGMVCRYGGVSWTCGREFPATSTAYTVIGTSKTNVWALGTMNDAWQWNGAGWSARTKPATPSWVMGAAVVGTAVLAVGTEASGMIYEGTAWRGLSLGTPPQAMYAAWAASTTSVFIVGSNGSILRYDGTSARPHNSGFTSSNVSAMWGSSDRDVWVFTLDGLGHHYDGTRWTISNTRDSDSPIRGIYIASSDRVALVSSSAVQFWDGARFTLTLTPTWLPRAVWGTGPNDIWVAGTSGCPYARWNGATWTPGNVPGCTVGIAAIHGTSASNMYMVSDQMGDSVYRWDGSKFTTITTGSTAAKTSVFTTSTRTFITTAKGEVLVGSGGSWSTSLSIGTSLGYITGWSADKVWVGGESSYVLSYKP